MRKLITIVIVMVTSLGFSQENPKQKDSVSLQWKMRIDLRSNQILTRISKPIVGYKYDLETRISIRSNRVELYEGIIFDIHENVRFTPSIGIEYLYKEKELNSRLRMSVRGQFDVFSFVINYGSDWETHGVNTRFVYDLIGNRFQLGFESINENIGPRIDMRINLGSKRVKLIYVYGSFVDNEFRYGIRIEFDRWFPVWDKKLKKLGEDLNPFKKSK